MRKLVLIAAALFVTQATAAPAPREGPAPYVATLSSTPATYDTAPWWMREGVIAVVGEVQTHIPANRANFTAQFSATDRSLSAAQKTVADRVRALARTLQAYGADKAQVETSLSVHPLYEQYRDKDGNLQTNMRADKIERYEVRVNFEVHLRDLTVLERAYAAVISAHPVSIQPVYFRLEPDNETNTELFKAAMTDVARRGRLAVEAVGSRLGKVRLIDPSTRACETDVLLAGAGRGLGDPAGVTEVMVTGSRRAAGYMAAAPAPPPPPPPPSAGEEVGPDQLLPLQPPLETLTRKACVIYGLD